MARSRCLSFVTVKAKILEFDLTLSFPVAHRPLIKTRVCMKRVEFGNENSGQFIDKDPGDTHYDLKTQSKSGTQLYQVDRRELEIGLQAANKMINTQTQTYYNRSVNAITCYDAQDFIGQTAEALKNDNELHVRLDRFIDRVAPRVERQLQSNEIINVFQDDFEMVGNNEAGASSKANTVNAVPRQFFDQSSGSKFRTVTCIKFHPQKPTLVAMSIVEGLTFDERAEVQGKSFESQVLILNFSDSQVIYA